MNRDTKRKVPTLRVLMKGVQVVIICFVGFSFLFSHKAHVSGLPEEDLYSLHCIVYCAGVDRKVIGNFEI